MAQRKRIQLAARGRRADRFGALPAAVRERLAPAPGREPKQQPR